MNRPMIGRAQGRRYGTERTPISIAPVVHRRLGQLLFEPELQGVGYSEFLDRACEVAETEIAEVRRAQGMR